MWEGSVRRTASQWLRHVVWVWEITVSKMAISVVLLKSWREEPRKDGSVVYWRLTLALIWA